MIVFTIGFTKKPASRFFQLLSDHGVTRVIDTRLNPSGQLSGFSKQEDLEYFLDRLNGCDYVYIPDLAPTEEILKDYRSDKDWSRYERRFEALMEERGIPGALDRAIFDDGPVCLLCSESTPENCHRRLVAERLAQTWGEVDIRHLT